MTHMAGREPLSTVPGCGKCADIAAAHLMTGQFYDAMADHLVDHETAPSIWGEVNLVAQRQADDAWWPTEWEPEVNEADELLVQRDVWRDRAAVAEAALRAIAGFKVITEVWQGVGIDGTDVEVRSPQLEEEGMRKLAIASLSTEAENPPTPKAVSNP